MRAIKKEVKTTTVTSETLIRIDGTSTIVSNPTKIFIGDLSTDAMLHELVQLYGQGTITLDIVQNTNTYTMDIETFIKYATIQPTENKEN